ncbi:hypothetical protein N7510_003045 [Penicillium lagena]|uniref:uncharacterized protein n=1 Tax=Penicillium lagena TaxID=94218 RepID=UPI002540C873|nr:uncharacterized protein N7510_003045 [Penicillium lagena]KAJ5619061.1 hypothetical protein N7510_003045 [Penicillium lagena]
MKRRITIVQPENAPFHPSQAELTTSALSVRDLDGAREDRITLGLDELPEELRTVLRQSHELHLRWSTERSYNAVAPFASRVSPGLHVFYTPLSSDQSSETLCPLLRAVFGDGVDCANPEESFITPPLLSTRFAASASLQFHSRLPSLEQLVDFIGRTACEPRKESTCLANAQYLLSADSLDIDYDSISHTLTLTSLWTSPPSGGWTEVVRKPTSNADQVEFGILSGDKAVDLEDLKMGGLLAVIGTHKKLQPTMFSFPSRHHPLPKEASYTISFPPPTGLHPTLSISMPQSSLQRPPAPEHATCALHTYLTLPSTIFGDQYQLGTSDPLFLESHNLVALRALAGETDLEAPDWVIPRWGSTWLLELATPKAESTEVNWTATIPLHLRYLDPSESGYRPADVPWPVVFWACTAEDGTKMGTNPFDRTNLGWDGLFGPRTMFFQLHPSSSSTSSAKLVEHIDVPVLRLRGAEGLFQARNIELGTVLVVGLGFLWVVLRLVRVAWSSGVGSKRHRGTLHTKKD